MVVGSVVMLTFGWTPRAVPAELPIAATKTAAKSEMAKWPETRVVRPSGFVRMAGALRSFRGLILGLSDRVMRPKTPNSLGVEMSNHAIAAVFTGRAGIAPRFIARPNEKFENPSEILLQIIGLNHANAAAVFPGQDRRELSRGQGGEDAGFFRVRKRETVRGQLRGRNRIVKPVVVRDQQRAVAVMELESRIRERVVDSELAQGGSNAADRDVSRVLAAAQDESGDHHAVAALDKPARADLRKL